MRSWLMGLVTVCLFVSLSGRAQDTATIVGTVTDPTGAAIPGAKVTVSNPDKGYVRNLVSDSAGAFTAPKVPIGNYVITGEAPGFQRLVRSGITLNVGQTLRVDLTMTVGQLSQEISVTGNVAKVETETGAISDVVTGTQVAELNLNGRNFTNLAILVPGAAPGGYDPSTIGVLGGVTMAFNGVNPVFNNWEIDGANNTDEGAGGTANTSYPNIDSIAEFRISTSNYGADYGKHSGATIEIATKAGTRDFHGDLFEFVRNDHLDANDWFINQQIAPPGGNAPKRPLKRNDYGFTIGGPIFIPGHYNTDKSKTFFFWTEDWRKNREGTVVRNWTPTMRMRQGDFSECDPRPGNPNYNPTVASNCVLPSGPGITGDIVPIDPNAAALLNGLVPLPNSGQRGRPHLALQLPEAKEGYVCGGSQSPDQLATRHDPRGSEPG
jgi:Carboxypeptidase regulatory-like domain